MFFINKLCLFGAAASTLLFGGFKLQDREESVQAGQLMLAASLASIHIHSPAQQDLPDPSETIVFFTPDFSFRTQTGHTVQLELKGVTDTRLLKSGRKAPVPVQHRTDLPVSEKSFPEEFFKEDWKHFISEVIKAGYYPQISADPGQHPPAQTDGPDLPGNGFITPDNQVLPPVSYSFTKLPSSPFISFSLRMLHSGSGRLARGQLDELS